MSRVALTYFPSLRNAGGQRVHTTWPALLGRLSVARVYEQKGEAPGFSIATYAGERRSLANVERVYAVGLDLDHFDALPTKMMRRPAQVISSLTWDDVTTRFDRVESFSHTTWSSTEACPRVRVFLRLDRGVTAEEYRRVYAYCADLVESYGFLVDRAASDPSRFWFLPSIPPGGVYRYSVGRGRTIRADVALATVPAAAPPPASAPRSAPTASADVVARAERYLEHCEPAIQGSGGSTVTFETAMKITRGFDLDDETAFQLLSRWNERCSPPWKPQDLRRKIHEAATKGTMAIGELRDRQRRSA